jgi:hypothetical protein
VIYLPYAADLLAQAHEVLAGTVRDTHAPQRYELLMALNALGIARREVCELEQVNAAAIAELGTLVAQPADRPDALSRQEQVDRLIAIGARLKAQIRAGGFDQERGAALRAALRRHVSRSLAISNPKALQA